MAVLGREQRFSQEITCRTSWKVVNDYITKAMSTLERAHCRLLNSVG